jgi:hypothetical protein
MTKAQKNKIVKAYRKAIKEIIGHLCDSEEQTDMSIFRGDEDRGQWAPESACVIHHERGIPSPTEIWDSGAGTVYMSEYWHDIDQRASELCGIQVFTEPHNSAVTAVWEG